MSEVTQIILLFFLKQFTSAYMGHSREVTAAFKKSMPVRVTLRDKLIQIALLTVIRL